MCDKAETEHTPGRQDDDRLGPCQVDGRRLYAFDEIGRVTIGEGYGLSRARHLAACWNAAREAGLSTDALEAGVVKELLEACEAAATSQHHPLCLRFDGKDPGDACMCHVGKARDLIAKAKPATKGV